MSENPYMAQEGKVFCNNPKTEDGAVEVCTCAEVNGIDADQVAEKLACRLNWPLLEKSRADEKDGLLDDAVMYLLSIDSKDVPGALKHAVLRAYEV